MPCGAGTKVLPSPPSFLEILRAEAGLRALGVQSGDLVTILSLNTPEAVIAFYAIDRIGAVANWVDMKLSPAEVEFYLTRAKSKVVLVLELIFQKVYANRGHAPAEHFVVLPLAPISRRSWGGNSGWASGKGRRDRDVSPGKNFSKIQGNLFRNLPCWEEPVAITYTGGTTGPAKGVMLSRRAFRASLEQYTQVGTMYGRGEPRWCFFRSFQHSACASVFMCRCAWV